MKQTDNFFSDPDRLAGGFLDGYVHDAGNGAGELNRHEACYTLRYWQGTFYLWDAGRYTEVSATEIKLLVKQYLHQLNEAEDAPKIAVTTHVIGNILLCVAGTVGVHIPEARRLNSWEDGREKLLTTIPVQNGLLMLDHNAKPYLDKHTPEYFCLNCLPYDFDPDAKCGDWDIFLDDVMQGKKEYIRLLQQWAGYLLRPDLKEQQFLLCVGPGANGKGVFAELIMAFVGESNCSQTGLAQFGRPFALYSMVGKLLNCTNESTHIIEDEAENVLKSLVAGDLTTFERKYKDSVCGVRPTAKIMICTNALPRFNDKTQGLWRRLMLVPFDKIVAVEAQIKNFADRLKIELPGVLNWAIRGLVDLNADGFIVPADSGDLKEQYRQDADPSRAFLLDNYQASLNGDSVSCGEVYQAYVQWCEENGGRPMNNRNFGRQVKRLFPDTDRVRRGPRGNRQWCYQSLVSY